MKRWFNEEGGAGLCVLALIVVALLCTGCTMNVYWTDNVVYGELVNGEKQEPRKLPNPIWPMPMPPADPRAGH